MKNRLFSLPLLMLWTLAACSPPATPTAGSPTAGPTTTPPPATLTTRPTTPADMSPVPTNSLAARPFPQHVRLAPGSILPSQRTQQQLDDDVRAFYDYWKATYLIEAGSSPTGRPLYRVAFGKELPNKDSTVSEGQGFGMLIVSFMAGHDPDAQQIFDGLWGFARLHPSGVDPRLMDWKVPDSASGNDSAFDGDADMAYSLLLADAQWGSQGRINYKADAQTLIGGILESTIGPQSRLPMLGDWLDPNGATYNQYTPRSSDFLPLNFRAYGRETGDPVWDEVIAQSQAVMTALQDTSSSVTGLMPDFIVMPGTDHIPQPAQPGFLEGEHDGHYSYNAGRVPWRVGTDAVLNDDAGSRAIVQKISTWAETVTDGNPHNFRAGYDLDGKPLPGRDYFTTFFVAPLGVAAMSNPAQQDWLNAVYDAVYSVHENYYEDTVTLLCLLVMSGNAWTP
jgi:endoglucanase